MHLLDAGADPNGVDDEGATALMAAAQGGHSDTLARPRLSAALAP